MATIAEWVRVDAERLVQSLQDAHLKLGFADGELVLDMCSVTKVNGRAISALDTLAAAAAEKKIKLVLRAVNIDVYRVLKVARLTERFSFLT
jgi:anti-anti-sigma regulatory factor